MAVFPLNLSELTVALGVNHLIDVKRVSALQARIKDLQRRGFPDGINTGKGKRAAYGAREVFLLAVAFEMLELGLNPEKAVALLRAAEEGIISEIRALVSKPLKAKSYVYFDPGALDELRDEADRIYTKNLFIGNASDLQRRLEKNRDGGTRLAVISLRRVIGDVIQGVDFGRSDTAIENEVIDELVDWALS